MSRSVRRKSRKKLKKNLFFSLIQFSIDLSITNGLRVICVDPTKVEIDIHINIYKNTLFFIYNKMVQIRNRKRKGLTKTVRKNIYTVHPFLWYCSSIGQSTALSRWKLRVRAPSIPLDINPKKEMHYMNRKQTAQII